MRKNVAAEFETLNTMMENNKLVVVLIHIWKDNTQYCADFTVVSSTITHQDIITGGFNTPSSQWGCVRTIPKCQVTEECQSSQPARSLVMQPDQLILCLPHNLTIPGYGTITLAAINQSGSKTDTWQVWVWCDTQ
jgi:hypothetical protein